jgi:3-hydroxyacyl-CoA dehydrogenase
MSDSRPVQKVAIIGTGVIGASWSALFLPRSLDVVATDIAPGAEASVRRFVNSAWPALKKLGLGPGASKARLTFIADMPTAVKGVDLVQENGPSASISKGSPINSSMSSCRLRSLLRPARPV